MLPDDQILKELQMLRKLKMMELSKAGFSQTQLADTLGIAQSTISKLMAGPKKKPD
jgi:predicted XRE-type DNA-binding protein